VRAFEDTARELYKAKIKDGDPLHIIAEYSPFRTQEGTYLYQFVIRDILDIENKKKSKKNVEDFEDEDFEEELEDEDEDEEVLEEEDEDDEEEDEDIWN
jgi:DNA-directed RNA polymerase specialized sigma24 family protein